MSLTAKRVLTDGAHDAIIASSSLSPPSSTPSDVAASLRSIGSRVRKSVTEGYITPNSSYTKAYSTGAVFRSANDTLRDIFPSSPVAPTPPSKLKRTYTQSEGYDSDGGVDDGDQEMHLTIPNFVQTSTDTKAFNRSIKALRKPKRTMLTTRSLPGGLLGFGKNLGTSVTGGSLNGLEEEDWSTSEISSVQLPLEPMILT
ncbi:hypothetical protein BDZ94DRAFT_714790 [Collybia nuda]|uniref:Uncharacterized protein n=1 Tax=Collybia nuda TaxID=64659 RepID=A0A9P5Y4N8_9AGAR|nr:hypothetical protein BDZ94DRAFT_714790 [Collybia nuda]